MITVFIADDSKLIRERLIAMLSDLPGIEIIGQAENGLEAMNSILLLKPDVAILDIRMPKGNGIDVLRKLRDSNITSKIIMLTNYPYPQYKKKCLKEGADYFFDKSTEFEKVVEILRHKNRESKKGNGNIMNNAKQ